MAKITFVTNETIDKPLMFYLILSLVLLYIDPRPSRQSRNAPV